jgi:hypothetical protein
MITEKEANDNQEAENMIYPAIIEKDDDSLLGSDNDSEDEFGSKFSVPEFAFDGLQSPNTSLATPKKVKEQVSMSFSASTSKAKRDQLELVLNFNAANLDGKKRFYQFGATALRYSNFDLFRKQLIISYPTLIIPPLPPKGIFIHISFYFLSTLNSFLIHRQQVGLFIPTRFWPKAA